MSARDEHPWTHKLHDNDGTLLEVSVSAADYEAMCDRIDTLTAERVELRSDLSDLNDEICECKVLEVTAELRSLRAAVKLWQWAIGDPKAMVVAEATLIGLARSWETEQ